MQEAEVSLRVALYYIRNGLTQNNIEVSIDGAQIKTNDQVHFDIRVFLSQNHFVKIEGDPDKWQGSYQVDDFPAKVIIGSTPGIGDVSTLLPDGTRLYVESKKGDASNKSNQEYSLMREAIGQLLTSGKWKEQRIPVVAVPYTKKSHELAKRWSGYPQIEQLGIRFYLVKEDGDIEII